VATVAWNLDPRFAWGYWLSGVTNLVADETGRRASGRELLFRAPRLLAIPATCSQAAGIQACFDSTPDYFLRTSGRAAGPDDAVRLLADAEADPARRVFLLVPRSGGPALGVLDLHLDYPEPGAAHIGLLLVRQAWQGMGFGRETTAALESALRRSGYRTLRLSVGDENPGARAFWERIGFAEAGRLDRGVTVYEKPLRGA
jgi:RimJ/RimL family protein N-acetyltransferase